jgi:uncharacterized protein (DUF2147 family)
MNWLFGVCFAVLGAVLPTAAHADATPDKNVFGYWKSIDKDSGKTLSIFRVWEDKGKIVAKIVKMFPKPNGQPPQAICTDCPGNQKGKPLVGLLFVWGLQADPENPRKWLDGKVINPEDGKTYNAELELAQDAKTLTLYGYIKMLVKVGGSNTWSRPTAEEMKGVPGAS